MCRCLHEYRMICCKKCLLPIIKTCKVDGTSSNYKYYMCDKDEIDIINVNQYGDLQCPNCNEKLLGYKEEYFYHLDPATLTFVK